MKLNVLNLVDKNTNQLHDLVQAAGTNIHSFYSWVHRTRSAARSLARKITRIEGSNAYQSYAQPIKLELRNRREMALATFDACELILTNLGYTPTEYARLTKDKIEDMFMTAIREEEQAAFTEEIGEE